MFIVFWVDVNYLNFLPQTVDEKNFKNVVVILLDGLGINILEIIECTDEWNYEERQEFFNALLSCSFFNNNFIKKINKEENITVILTTHDMADIEYLAKRIIMIGNGEVVYDGTLKNLKQKYDHHKHISVTTGTKLKKLVDKLQVSVV